MDLSNRITRLGNVRRTLVCRVLNSEACVYRGALAITRDKLKFVGHSGALALVEVHRV